MNRVENVGSGSKYILGMRVDLVSYRQVVDLITGWAGERRSRRVCVANVHMTMETNDSPEFREIINSADLVVPDGVPLVWAARALGAHHQERVYGPALTLQLCAAAARESIPVALYGGTPESLAAFSRTLTERFPGLRLVCHISPPFRELVAEEDRQYTELLVNSGAGIVLVGIGCPKQERWMWEHRNDVPAVMVGVGAAFDFHSGRVRQAPLWIQRIGMEWFFRLLMEPRRLWRRYLRHNPRFVVFLLQQFLGLRRY